MTRNLPALLAAAALAACGLMHGLWAGRWAPSAGLEGVVARLDRVPLAVGDWRGQALTMDRRQLEAGEIDGCLYRRYERPSTGDVVTVLLVCGRPGPIALHPPTACYAGGGYEFSAPARREVRWSGGPRAEFFAADFRKPAATPPQHLRIFWAWSDSGTWRAPDAPRLAYGASPHLFKLYVIRQVIAAGGAPGGDPGVAFLEQMLPELGRALFTPSLNEMSAPGRADDGPSAPAPSPRHGFAYSQKETPDEY